MDEKHNNSEKKSSIAVILITIVEKVLGFAKQVVFAAFFGASAGTDVYYLAQTLFSIFNSCFNTSVPISTLSVYVHSGLQHKGEKFRKSFIENAISAMLAISAVLVVCVLVLSHFIGFLPFVDFDLSELDELKTYMQILAAMILAYTLSGMCGTGLECLRIYAPNKYAALFVSVASIVGVVLFGKEHGIIVAIYAALAGIVLHALYVSVLLHSKLRFRLVRPRCTPQVKQVLLLSFPIMVGAATNSINSLIDKCIAISLGASVASALTYASLVALELVTAVLITAVSSIMITRFADSARQKNYVALNASVNMILSIMLFAIIPIIMIFLTQSQEIMTIVFKRGAFDEHAVILSSQAFMAYSIGLFFIPLREVMIRVQYSCQNSRTPMINSLGCIILNVAMSLLFSRFWGVFGIAIATSISIALNGLLNFVSVRWRTHLALTSSVKNALSFSLSAFFAAIPCYWFKEILNANVFIDFLSLNITFCLLYVIAAYIINRTAVKNILSIIHI